MINYVFTAIHKKHVTPFQTIIPYFPSFKAIDRAIIVIIKKKQKKISC